MGKRHLSTRLADPKPSSADLTGGSSDGQEDAGNNSEVPLSGAGFQNEVSEQNVMLPAFHSSSHIKQIKRE